MMHRMALVVGLVVGLALLAGGGQRVLLAQTATEGWSERAPLLAARSEMAIAGLNGRIYALGGYPGTRVTTNEVQVWDAQTDSWSLGPALPQPLHHTMTAVVDGHLYLFGGEAGNPSNTTAFQNGVYLLDEQAGAWLPRAPMPTPRSAGGTGVIDGKVYVAGGRPPHGSDFAVYDPATDSWTTLPNVPTQRNHLGVGAIDGKLYVAGGRFGGGVGSEMTDLLEIYDPVSNTWTSGPSMLAPRAGVASTTANGCLYLIGGEGNTSDPRGIFDRNELFDPGTQSWRGLDPLPTPMHGLTGAAFLDGWIHVPGGATHAGVSGDFVTTAHQVFRADQTCGPAGG